MSLPSLWSILLRNRKLLVFNRVRKNVHLCNNQYLTAWQFSIQTSQVETLTCVLYSLLEWGNFSKDYIHNKQTPLFACLKTIDCALQLSRLMDYLAQLILGATTPSNGWDRELTSISLIEVFEKNINYSYSLRLIREYEPGDWDKRLTLYLHNSLDIREKKETKHELHVSPSSRVGASASSTVADQHRDIIFCSAIQYLRSIPSRWKTIKEEVNCFLLEKGMH
jgi:hypothetical protein